LANSVWIFLWHYEQFPLTLIAMLVLLASLIVSYLRLNPDRAVISAAETWMVRIPFSIYLGWITVATAANVTSVLDFLKWDGFGLDPEIWMTVVLAAVLVIAVLMNVTRFDVAYTLVILWALAGISVKQAGVSAVAVPTWITFGLVTLSLVGPFLIRVPPLPGLQPPQALADADSQFISINGVNVHIKKMGQGDPIFVLLHGFGASLYSWHAVAEPLSQLGTVIAFDRPAFGLTERPLTWKGLNPYTPEAQVALTIGLLDHFGIQRAILIGNSAGGTVSMQVALAHPERVSALILVDPLVNKGGGSPEWVRPLLASPQIRRFGPLLSRQLQSRGSDFLFQAWHDPAKFQPEMIELYKKPFKVENWDKALWEFTLASHPTNVIENLSKFTLPVLVITGDDDRIVPTKNSIQLAGDLPKAQLVVIENAGHVPHEEQPSAFMDALRNFLKSLAS
jgi:pimeloyl-ACP methyl ester carboxylesterase